MPEAVVRAEESSATLSLRMNALESSADGIWVADPDGEILYRHAAAGVMEGMYWSRDGHVCIMEDAVFTTGNFYSQKNGLDRAVSGRGRARNK